MKCKFTVVYPLPNADPLAEARTARIVDIKEFHEARNLADMNNGKVYPQLPGGLCDPIYPEPEVFLDWGEFNFAMCLAARVVKLPPEPMFNYVVRCGDYNIGGYEWNTEYSGTDRGKALEAYKRAKSWMGMADVSIKVLGRKEPRKEEEEEWDDDWFDEPILSDFD